jgi:hypothetical protein
MRFWTGMGYSPGARCSGNDGAIDHDQHDQHEWWPFGGYGEEIESGSAVGKRTRVFGEVGRDRRPG